MSARLACTQQLGALGDAVPTVTQVMVHAQSNGTLLVTLTGTHVAPHAELIIDGRPGGMVSQSTSQQLVAVISDAAWSPGPHVLGVRNPDGAAAQMVLGGDDHDHGQQGGDHSRPAPPEPTSNSDDD